MAFESILDFLVNTAFYAYLVIFALGLVWVLISLLLGGLGHMLEVASDVAHDIGGETDSWGHQQIGLSPFSPLMLSVFAMLFGVTGMVLESNTAWSHLAILGVTVLIAVALDTGVYAALYNFFVKAQSSSMASQTEAVGTVGIVATRVAPGMTGTINYETAGRRTLAGARSADNGTHEPGEVVTILSMEGGVARVKKKE